MAKKKNLKHKSEFEAFRKELRSKPEPPKIGRRNPLRYFLIVTEGAQTEPSYFRALFNDLPGRSVHVEVAGQGTNTMAVVDEAIRLREARKSEKVKPPFDEVWAVFDKDEFPAERFNTAVEKANRERIGAAYSNLLFELWFVLHFQMLETPIDKDRYIEILKEKLGGYDKSDANVYRKLQEKGNENAAISRAAKLLKMLAQGNPARENPTTRVHELVKKLREIG